MYKRSIDLSKIKQSFFLWGPRQVGKSSLLKEYYGGAQWIDLLKSENFITYQQNPALIREFAKQNCKKGDWLVIDEVQKVPDLLNEVHWLIENMGLNFALCGSSARKLKRGHANLLGGRALRRELFGLTANELGKDFDIEKFVNRGSIPNHYLNENYEDRLISYCTDYLKEEIFAEGIIRNLPAFSSFLKVASFSDSEQVDFANIAREVGVSAPTIKSYFEILDDTIIGQFIPAYRKKPKRRTQMAPKFYFFDVGVVNSLAKRKNITIGSSLFGKGFESWVFHELRSYKSYFQSDMDISYWRLSEGREVDFILNDLECCIEVKGSEKIIDNHLKGLREIKVEYPNVKKRVLVCLEKKSRKTGDGIEILPMEDFIKKLWSSTLF